MGVLRTRPLAFAVIVTDGARRYPAEHTLSNPIPLTDHRRRIRVRSRTTISGRRQEDTASIGAGAGDALHTSPAIGRRWHRLARRFDRGDARHSASSSRLATDHPPETPLTDTSSWRANDSALPSPWSSSLSWSPSSPPQSTTAS